VNAAADTLLSLLPTPGAAPHGASIVPVVRRRDGEIEGLGTAFCIAVLENDQALFLTAAHVLQPVLAESWGQDGESPADILVFLPSIDPPNLSLPRPRGHICKVHDIGLEGTLLGLDTAGFIVQLPPGALAVPLRLTFDQPVIGSRTAAIGYQELTVRHYFPELRQGRFFRSMDRAVGAVETVFPIRRDSALVTFPCFQTNARSPSGLSGGPVMDVQGRVIGVLSVGSEVGENTAATSYCSLLGPYVWVEFHIRSSSDALTPYTLGELIAAGTVPFPGNCRVFHCQVNGVGVTWEQPPPGAVRPCPSCGIDHNSE